MNKPENFLARWSRRKHAAAAETEETKSSGVSSPAALGEGVGSEPTAGAGSHIVPSIVPNTAEPPFDPLSVPPIEAIAADTDIRGFLARGVPPELTRAALRRTWATDPKIRDFVGLADYDWDFNSPGSMAGFGSLEMTDELPRAATQIVGPTSRPAPTAGTLNPTSVKITQNSRERDLVAQARPIGHEDDHVGLTQTARLENPRESRERNDLPDGDQESASAQCRSGKPEASQLIVHQSHGGALPK
jgi:hypothetical protein